MAPHRGSMAECELPFGSPFSINQGIAVEDFDGLHQFYKPPPETPIDVFLTVSRRLVCLWSSHLKNEQFASDTQGGYSGLYEWTSADWKNIKIKTFSGSVDCFMLAECQEQFPVKSSFHEGFSTGSLGWFLEYFHTKDNVETSITRTIESNLISKVVGEEFVLLKQFSNGKWHEFSSGMKMPFTFTEITFNPKRQLISCIHNDTLTNYIVKSGEVEVDWECPVAEGSKICWSNSGNTLAIVSAGRISLFHWGGVLVAEIAVKVESVLSCFWNSHDTELMIGTRESIHVVPCSKPISAAFPSQNRFTSNQILLFRQDLLLKAGEWKSSWDLINVPMDYLKLQTRPIVRQCAEGRDWISITSDIGLAMFSKSKRSFEIYALDLCILQLAWLNDLLIVLCRSGSRHETSLKVLNSTAQVKQSITLIKSCVSFSITSSGHVMIMFDDLTVHLYRITTPKPGQVMLQFDLNLSLSLFTGGHSRAQSPLCNWQVDLFEKQTIASPSEVDLHQASISKVIIEQLLFLQGDSLFSVLIRNTSLADAVTSTVIEAEGTFKFFILPNHFGDSWLLTLHEDCVRCRKWPFGADFDIEISLKFFPTTFYPNTLCGLFVGTKVSVTDRLFVIQHSDILPLLPFFAKYYLIQNDHQASKKFFDSIDCDDMRSVMFEFLLIDIIEMPRSSSDSSNLLHVLHKNAPHLMGSKRLYLKSLVRAARKIDVSDADWLFGQVASVETIFNDCLAEGDVETAAMFLMLRLVLPNTEDGSENENDDRIPVVNLISLAIADGNYKLVFDLRKFIVSIWEDPKDIDLIDSAIRLAAKELVKFHRWTSFITLSSYWAQVKDTSLFDVCFGKMKVTDLKSLLLEIGYEGIVCAIFAQLEMPLPTSSALKKARRNSQMATPVLATASSISLSSTSKTQPTRINPSYTDVVEFFNVNDDLRWIAAIWKASVEGDTSRMLEFKQSDYAGYIEFRDTLASSKW